MRSLVALCVVLCVRFSQADDASLQSYLDKSFPASVAHVAVDATEVRIEGSRGTADGDLSLIELPVWGGVIDPIEPISAADVAFDETGRFTKVVERQGESGERLLSRWALARKTDNGYALVSHARYADEIAPIREIEEMKPRNRKGLGAFDLSRPVEDIEDLGVSAVTVNIVLSNLLWLEPGEGRTPREFAGRTWHVNEGAFKGLDRNLLAAAEKKLVVSAILLIPQAGGFADPDMGKRMTHPDADPSGIFVMPNLTTAEGVLAYAAVLDTLAERYSRPGGEHGRIHHWILHNEVNSGWVWTNAGEKSVLEYVDLYHKSLRMTHLIARQYDAHAKAFVSLDHHWTTRHNEHCYRAKDVLETLLKFSHAEGDFDWAIAHHPYPQDLGNPRVWENEQATLSFDTPKITYKNLEVLDAWVKRPEARFRGERPRTVHLTEQGLNSRNYREKSLRDQAAGMAYAWNKMKPLETIEMFHYHNWVDNRGEGGLRIGLRKFPDDAKDPLGKKPIWHVYRALGTEDEARATDFAKEVIGIGDWSEVQLSGEVR